MPIHDLSYRHWSGEWTSHPYRWWVITRQGIRLLSGKKWFLGLMLLSAIPFLVRCVILYFSTVAGSLPLVRINPKFFHDFISQQMGFAFPIAIFAGAGSIANDLRANALEIYLSKPITRRDYAIGKLGVLVFFLTLPTLVPGLLLFVLAVLFRSDLTFLEQNYWVPGAIAAYAGLIIAILALVMLALSSLTRSSRFAAMNFAGLFLFGTILYGILRGILRTSSVAWVSLSHNLTQIGDVLFGLAPDYATPVWVSALILAAVAAGSAWLVDRRVRAVEVIE
jgi:ABC-2 type transport system permease protein